MSHNVTDIRNTSARELKVKLRMYMLEDILCIAQNILYVLNIVDILHIYRGNSTIFI